MSIYKQIQKDKLQPGANRSLLSLIMGEICVDGKPMEDGTAIVKLSQMKKNAEKSYALIVSAEGQTKRADEELEYISLIENYMPQGATENDILAAIDELGVDANVKSMGAVMKHLKAKFQIVDGNLVKQVLMGGK